MLSIDIEKIEKLLDSKLSSNKIAKRINVSAQTIINYRENGIEPMSLRTASKLTRYAEEWINNNTVSNHPLVIDFDTITKTDTTYPISIDGNDYLAYICTDISETMFILLEQENDHLSINLWDDNQKDNAVNQIPSPFNNLAFYYRDELRDHSIFRLKGD